MTVMQRDMNRLTGAEATSAAATVLSPSSFRRSGAILDRSWPPALRALLAIAFGFAILLFLVGLALAPRLRELARGGARIRSVHAPSKMPGACSEV